MEPILSLKNVCYYFDKVQVIYDINVDVYPGEIVSVIGANGAGKTPLVKLLCGLYAPTSGTIRIDGVPAAEFRRDDYAALFAPVFQEVRTACLSLAETAA